MAEANGVQAARSPCPSGDRADRVRTLDRQAASGVAVATVTCQPGGDQARPRCRRAARGRTAARPRGRMGNDEEPIGLARIGATPPSGGRSMVDQGPAEDHQVEVELAQAGARAEAGRTPARTASAPARRAIAPVDGSGPAGTSSPTTALRNHGWSSAPTGPRRVQPRDGVEPRPGQRAPAPGSRPRSWSPPRRGSLPGRSVGADARHDRRSSARVDSRA